MVKKSIIKIASVTAFAFCSTMEMLNATMYYNKRLKLLKSRINKIINQERQLIMNAPQSKDEIATILMASLLTHGYVQRGAYPDENKWYLRFGPKKAAEVAYEYATALLEEKFKQEKDIND